MEDWGVEGEIGTSALISREYLAQLKTTDRAMRIATISLAASLPDIDPETGKWMQTFGALPEAPVSRDMRMSGGRLIRDGRQPGSLSPEDDAERIYRVMAALAPVPLVSDGEFAALRERHEARTNLNAAITARVNLENDFARLCALLDARDARIAELKTILAEKAKTETPAVQRPTPEPKAFPTNALKPSSGDPRRIGG